MPLSRQETEHMQDRIKIVVAVDDRGTVSAVYTNREDIIVECAVIDYDLVG